MNTAVRLMLFILVSASQLVLAASAQVGPSSSGNFKTFGDYTNARPAPTTGTLTGTYRTAKDWVQTGAITCNYCRLLFGGAVTFNNTVTAVAGVEGNKGGQRVTAGELPAGGLAAGAGAFGSVGACGGGHGGAGGAGGGGYGPPVLVYPVESLLSGSGGGAGGDANGGDGGGSFYVEAIGNVTITSAAAISANGGNAATATAEGGAGGAGGGIDIRTAAAMTVAAGATLSANGGNGSNGSTAGGGGGGGGIVQLMAAGGVTNSGTVTVTGGSAGTGGSPAATAGSAGVTNVTNVFTGSRMTR